MSSSTKLPVSRIGKYRLLKHIATGGMGTVYKAQDTETGAAVALKVLSPSLANSPILVERFKREARHAEKMDHKNIVKLIGYGHDDGMHYLAMEYIDGVDLSEYIARKGKLDHEEARRIIIQACKGLSHAAELGIIHRDIKPSNFLLANDEGRCRVKLTDLGLSRMENEEEYRVTRAGTTVGTVDYMAPEQARDASLADVRSDIYSLGCTLYHMLSGRPPFAEGGIGERVYKHIATDPQDIRELAPEVPIGLWTVLRRMLAKHPDDRFQTPDECIEALRSLADDPSFSRIVLEDIEPGTEEPTRFDLRTAEAPPAPRKPAAPVKRTTTLPEMPAVADEGDVLGVTPEQRQMAHQQFTHATEVVRGKGDPAYALQLLLACVKLDPANTLYRKMLREVGREKTGGKAGWFSSLTTLPARGRIKAARRNGEHRSVLEQGEELLVRVPGDIAIQLDMAASAQDLRMPSLARWLLEEARSHAPMDLSILRGLAAHYEERKLYAQAIEAWEQIKKADPSDTAAGTKIKDLAANETIARSQGYKK
ncbi:MAG: serine/threonine protein kinase [Gemmataceae bacterium]|nr:serine/threonine protein kinase [Gemmataceae bacterium]